MDSSYINPRYSLPLCGRKRKTKACQCQYNTHEIRSSHIDYKYPSEE